MGRWPVRLAVLLGLALGFTLSHVGPAEATRASSGAYSLPSGNPVVTGTSISSTWANNTLSDLASEMTDSLSRSGKGAMTAPLELANGSVGTPALSFDSDTDCGLYRIGANNPGLAVNGVLTQSWATTGSTLPLGLTVTQSQSATAGIVTTGGATSGRGITANGTGSGAGVFATAGATGVGVVGAGGATSGEGAHFTGGGTGGIGVLGTGGTGNGVGGYFSGVGTGAGLVAENGTAYTAAAPTTAAILNGSLTFNVTDPNSNVSLSNVLNRGNTPKAWGSITTANGSPPTITGGFNVTSVGMAGGGKDITVTLGADCANANYAVLLTENGIFDTFILSTTSHSTGAFDIHGWDTAGSAQVDFDTFAATNLVSFLVFCPQ